MKLRYDPYRIFRFSRTPAGLYARQKWLGEAGSRQWKMDYEATVTSLLAGQMPDGSWGNGAGSTIQHLFGLHLTVRHPNSQIDAGLSYLLEKIRPHPEGIDVIGEVLATEIPLCGLPFTAGRPDMLLIGATLFLATIFNRQRDPHILSAYQQLGSMGVKGNGRWLDTASSHNIFRAMVVHPVFAKDKSTEMAVERLAGAQTERGDWGPKIPFYQTVNALAHLHHEGVVQQLETAFRYIYGHQRSDGTWVSTDLEWDSFLVVHALKNRKML